MSFSLVVSSKASKELNDSINRYDEQSSELGDRFEESISVTLQSLINNPNIGSLIEKGYRQVVVSVFPYVVVYKINTSKEIILVTSIFHTSRSPSKKFRQQ